MSEPFTERRRALLGILLGLALGAIVSLFARPDPPRESRWGGSSSET